MDSRLSHTIVFVAGLSLAGAAFASDETRELDSHEHGHVKLEIAIEKDQMNIAMEAPGESIVGFEHAAKTTKQKAAVKAAEKQLLDAGALFVLPANAGCEVTSSKAELHQHGKHNEFEASYAFKCSNISELKKVETNLFSIYPAIEEIDVDYISPNGQGSAELEADFPAVVFAPAS